MRLLFVAVFLAWALPAQATRVIYLPTMQVSTMHGGIMSSTTCVTANMLGISAYGATDTTSDGVQLAYHSYTFNFKNISTATQTVTLKTLSGTGLTSSNSSGVGGVPTNPNGPTRGDPNGIGSQTVSLAPAGTVNSEATLQVTFSVTDTGAAISPYDAFLANGNPQVCLGLVSKIAVEVDVNEDRGAIIGSVEAGAHRGYGRVDTWMSAPISFQINGGRPF